MFRCCLFHTRLLLFSRLEVVVNTLLKILNNRAYITIMYTDDKHAKWPAFGNTCANENFDKPQGIAN